MNRKYLLFIFIIAVGIGLFSQSKQRARLISQVAADSNCPEANITATWHSGRSSYVDVTACGKRCTYYSSFFTSGLLGASARKISCE
jgi:hypothetical protein